MSRIAPDGTIWVCGACGRSNKDRDAMGDTSCITHAVLVHEHSIQRNGCGQVIAGEAVRLSTDA